MTSLTLNIVGPQVVTYPEYQRQGHAKRLVKLGLKFADKADKKWYAACLTAASTTMYKNLGFEFQTEEVIDLSKYGSTGKATVTVLTRESQSIDLLA
jgi:predicted N-acetyltransferase YhbS